jgi:hypothetical protein
MKGATRSAPNTAKAVIDRAKELSPPPHNKCDAIDLFSERKNSGSEKEIGYTANYYGSENSFPHLDNQVLMRTAI